MGNDHMRGASLANNVVYGSGVKKTIEIVLQEPVHEFICSIGRAQLEWGTSNCVTITADDNIEPLLDALYSSQKLICLCTKENMSLRPKVPIQFHVTLGNESYIKMFQASGSAAIKCCRSTLINKDILTLKVSGNGTIAMLPKGHMDRIDVTEVHLSAQGGGKISVDKYLVCTDCIATISGTGKLLLEDITAKISKIGISGVGKCEIQKLDLENVCINSSGNGALCINTIHVKNKCTIDLAGCSKCSIRQGWLENVSINASGTSSVDAACAQSNHCTANLSGTNKVYLYLLNPVKLRKSGCSKFSNTNPNLKL
jgi:hypothetical protein